MESNLKNNIHTQENKNSTDQWGKLMDSTTLKLQKDIVYKKLMTRFDTLCEIMTHFIHNKKVSSGIQNIERTPATQEKQKA